MSKKTEKENKNYRVWSIIVDEKHDMYQYFFDNASMCKNLFNTCTFIYRQLLFQNGKEVSKLSEHELQVLNLFADNLEKVNAKRRRKGNPDFSPISEKYYFPNYQHLNAVLYVSEQPDYWQEISPHAKQQVLKLVVANFKSFFKAMKEFAISPDKFTGKPQLPRYSKSDLISYKETNQTCVLKNIDDKYIIKFPNTKKTITLGNKKPEGKFVEVRVVPTFNKFKIEIVFEVPKNPPVMKKAERIMGIDLGIDNIVTISNNIGIKPTIVKGNAIKSLNQYYNKQSALLHSELMKGKSTTGNTYISKRIQSLTMYRNNYINDAFHKLSKQIVNLAIENNIDTIVIGKNTQWKTECNIGKINNQNFVQIPYNNLVSKITYKANAVGINVIVTEESYTSKANIFNEDIMLKDIAFTGKRIHRGLYKTNDSTIINADINGASNIIRKVFPTAFANTDKRYLLSANKIKIA